MDDMKIRVDGPSRRVSQGSERSHMKPRVVRLIMTVAAVLVLFAVGVAQTNAVNPTIMMREAEGLYIQGVGACNEPSLARAGELYRLVIDRLRNDPQGLGQQFQQLLPKAVYKLGWSYYRRAEIGSDMILLDSAVAWFSQIDIKAADSLGLYAAYMIGECKYRQAENAKYDLLCSHAASPEAMQPVDRLLDQAEAKFQTVISAVQNPAAPLRLTAELRKNNIRQEKALLLIVRGNFTDALSQLGTIDYGVDNSPAGLAPVVKYSEAMRLYYEYFLTRDSALSSRCLELFAYLGEERTFREASLAFLRGDYIRAAASFHNSSNRFVEALYWQGFSGLITSGNLPELRNSRGAFDAFIAGRQQWRNDLRLSALAVRAKHKSLLLGIAIGQRIPDDLLQYIGREEVKFLIRVAASLPGSDGTTILNALEHYLSTPQPGGAGRPIRFETVSPCVAGMTIPLSHDEALFYRGLVKTLLAMRSRNNSEFEQAAEIMRGVSGDYAGEAKYVRANCLYEAGQQDQARTLLSNLISQNGSVRALNIYGYNESESLNLDSLTPENRQILCGIFRQVQNTIQQAGTPSDYATIETNAGSMLDKCRCTGVQGFPVGHSLPGMDNVHCPDILSIDRSGPEPEVVFYEGLSDLSLIKKRFAEECESDLITFGLPTMHLLPASKHCGTGRGFDNSFAPIPDGVYVEDKWKPFVNFVSESAGRIDRVDQCSVVTRPGQTAYSCLWNDSAGRYTVEPAIPIGDTIEIGISKEGYYLSSKKLASIEPGFIEMTIPLTEVSKYGFDGSTAVPEDNRLVGGACLNYVLIRHHDTDSDVPPALEKALTDDVHLRDFTYDNLKRRYLGVDWHLNTAIVVCPENGSCDTMALQTGPAGEIRLERPEGIAVDSMGNIYIADFGNDRVVKLDSELRAIATFGNRGANTAQNAGDSARLSDPTRIAMEEDLAGFSATGDKATYYREPHLLVADQYGIHRFDSRAQYLDTPVDTAKSHLAEGEFYDFSVFGYGKSSIIYVVNRITGEVLKFSVGK